MKYNDNGTYKDIYVKTFDTLPVGAIVEFDGQTIPDGWTDIGNNKIKKISQFVSGEYQVNGAYSTSQDEAYSCEYINKIGTTVNLFGNVGGSSVGTFDLYSHIVATKINSNTWKFDIEGQMDISGATQQYIYGIMPNKISELLNTAIGVQVQFDNDLLKLGNWNIINKTTKLPYVDKYQYGTVFEYSSGYLQLARYYTTTGSTGSWALDSWENGSFMKATVYLREL